MGGAVRRRRGLWRLWAATFLLPRCASASKPRFSNTFQKHMVLQRGRPLRVWGFGASAGEALTVSLKPGGGGDPGGFLQMKSEAFADEDGRWEAAFATPPEQATGRSMTLSVSKAGSDKVFQELSDVTFGDVYLFTGQSNVDLPESYALQYHPQSQRAEEEFADEMGRKGLIRVMIVPNQVPGLNYGQAPARELTRTVDCRLCPPPFGPKWDRGYKVCHCNALAWTRASAGAMRGFSALGWFSGAALRNLPMLEGVPLGLVRSSWGGTKILRWSGPDAVKKCPQNMQPRGMYADLFSNMIYPMAKLEFSAVVWMHGASDTGGLADYLGPNYYACALPAMIQDWREKFERALPFIVVELPAYCNERDWATFHTFCDQKKSILETTEYHLPAMRIAQAASEKLPHVYMVTAMDLGSLHPLGGSIHSDRKQELGSRVAMAARAAAYGDTSVIWEAPKAIFARVIHPHHVSVHFATRPNEFLVLNNSARCPAEILNIYCTGGGFELLSGGVWVPALSAWLGQNKSVVLRTHVNASVKRVRYAFADWPVCSLRSAVTGLPARIFDIPVTVWNLANPHTAPVSKSVGDVVQPAKYLSDAEKEFLAAERRAEGGAQQLEKSVAPVLQRAVRTAEEQGQESLGEAEGFVLPRWPIVSLVALAFLGTLCVIWHAVVGEGKALEPRTLSRARVLEADRTGGEAQSKGLLSPPSTCSETASGGTSSNRVAEEDACLNPKAAVATGPNWRDSEEFDS